MLLCKWNIQILDQRIWLLLCTDLNMKGIPEFIMSCSFIVLIHSDCIRISRVERDPQGSSLTPSPHIKRESSGLVMSKVPSQNCLVIQSSSSSEG